MYHIYLITNLMNGKVYVGQTKKSIETRFKDHIRYSVKHKTYLASAICKYGSSAFKTELIEIVATKQEANIAETKHIKNYDQIIV